MHTLIIGQTESGKTTLAVRLSEKYQQAGWKVAVLDPLRDERWRADFLTTDDHEFLAVAKASRSCMLFVDESGQTIGRYQESMFWLATMARHWGHCSHFLSQRAQQVSPTVRTQCGRLFLFNCSATDAKILADEWNKPELREANSLAKGEYFSVSRFAATERHQLFGKVARNDKPTNTSRDRDRFGSGGPRQGRETGPESETAKERRGRRRRSDPTPTAGQSGERYDQRGGE